MPPSTLFKSEIYYLQIQTELGDSHINIINALEVILTSTNLALVLEYAQGSSLTHYVGQRWQHAQHTGAFLSEDESRYLFRVRLQNPPLLHLQQTTFTATGC